MNFTIRGSALATALSFFSILLMTLSASPANAFDELNKVQSLIYDHGHLANTSEGQTLTYRYAGNDGADATVDDEATLQIVANKEDGRRDVELDFLSDERHLPLPPFQSFRGNPIIIAMLEHIAQNMSAQSGGGALYFRNRIRDAIASKNVELEEKAVSVAGNEYDTTSLIFYPFVDDERLADNELMRATKFSIELSDDIPGGVISVAVTSRIADEVFERTLSIN